MQVHVQSTLASISCMGFLSKVSVPDIMPMWLSDAKCCDVYLNMYHSFKKPFSASSRSLSAQEQLLRGPP